MKSFPSTLAILLFLLALTGCGGSGAPAAPDPSPQEPDTPWVEPDPEPEPDPNEWRFAEMLRRANRCEVPRTGIAPDGFPYQDVQGTRADEMLFLRAWIKEGYLWYDEVPLRDYREFTDPVAYFATLKTPALTASGQAKDKYHFTYDSARWDRLQLRGASIGYGVSWASANGNTLPRLWLAAAVEPGSPAAGAGLQRGDQLMEADGIDFEHAAGAANADKLNAALFPATVGEAHRLVVRREGILRDIALVSGDVSVLPVKDAKVFETVNGKVGYLNFSSHNAVSERRLIESFTQFKAAGVNDLVLDLRYNGGGLLYVASQLAYMIAGPAATEGKVFERPVHNDKTAQQPVFPFYSKAYGFAAPQPAPRGQALPYLSLKHVTVLATAGTCSASEAIINGLRGIDIEVTIIGERTCGKPFAFTPTPNCGTTYFAIEFQGVNAKGTGDYADGFAADCQVADDMGRAQGDPAEGMLAAALQRQASGSCPAPRAGLRARIQSLLPVRSPAEEVAIAPR